MIIQLTAERDHAQSHAHAKKSTHVVTHALDGPAVDINIQLIKQLITYYNIGSWSDSLRLVHFLIVFLKLV